MSGSYRTLSYRVLRCLRRIKELVNALTRKDRGARGFPRPRPSPLVEVSRPFPRYDLGGATVM